MWEAALCCESPADPEPVQDMNPFSLLPAWKDWLALILSLLLSLLAMNTSDHPSATAFRQNVGQYLTFMTAPVTFFPRSLNIWRENAQLRADLIRLAQEEYRWRDALLENARLRKLLGFRDRPEFDYLAAEVIARDPSMTYSTLMLDKGARDSVRVGQAVVTAEGLAGMIHRVTPSTSLALLAVDRNFAASARVERSRVDGIVRWVGGDVLELSEVPRNLDVKVGDRVVTSGLGGVIPGGLPVGIVRHVEENDNLFLRILVEPYVKFNRLEEVFILLPRGTAVLPTASMESSR